MPQANSLLSAICSTLVAEHEMYLSHFGIIERCLEQLPDRLLGIRSGPGLRPPAGGSSGLRPPDLGPGGCRRPPSSSSIRSIPSPSLDRKSRAFIIIILILSIQCDS